MHDDKGGTYRRLLEDSPPRFGDRVDTPWDQVPDFEDFNRTAYNRVVRALKELTRQPSSGGGLNSQGILVLGEAGTGKTHLLMRVARNLSATNHILFIRKPNNEEAVGQHVWANVVSSLARSLPASGSQRSQLDDLLAHVFKEVLVPEFEQDIKDGVDVEQRKRWADRLRADPYALFNMLGDGEKRQDNMDKIRRRTLRYLQIHHPDVDQKIARVLITYCFVLRDDRKRVLLTWLAGEDVDEAEARDLGLPPCWVTVEETSSDVSVQRQKEELALRAIRTIGILSTYYQPLILAFDQLEGLRDQPRLTQVWGDVVREIFTMTPNLLIVTCVFPSLWGTWFAQQLDQSVAQRIAQQVVTLETFESRHAFSLLSTHLKDAFEGHRLPTSIFPFTDTDVQLLCASASSPRSFIQAARSAFNSWLDGEHTPVATAASRHASQVVSQAAIDDALRSALSEYGKLHDTSYDKEFPAEQDFFGRIKNLSETLLAHTDEPVRYSKAALAQYVMPPNFVIWPQHQRESLCIAVANSAGNAFTARIRNLMGAMAEGSQFANLVLLRDRRCKQVGPRGQEYLREIEQRGGMVIHADREEITGINAHYDTLVALEEHAISVGSVVVDKRQFAHYVRSQGSCDRIQMFRSAAQLATNMAKAVGAQGIFAGGTSTTSTLATKAPFAVAVNDADPTTPGRSSAQPSTQPTPMVARRSGSQGQPPAAVKPFLSPPRRVDAVSADIVIGDRGLDGPNMGIVGELRDEKKRLGISWTKPQCVVLLGYMGSGKSYALGVLIENALLAVRGLIRQGRAMSVVAFNFRRNPESRFEYSGFAIANDKQLDVDALRLRYGATPCHVDTVNVFAYEAEIPRRQDEYRDVQCYPIKFRPDELSAEHWEILMKPPSAQSEYMDIVRDIIRKLYYQERLTYKNLEMEIVADERLSVAQRRRAMNRMSFAERWISDERSYDWTDVLGEGTLNVFDLRMQAMESSEALKLCLIVTDLVRRAKNGVNKMIVFDEAHEYVDCKELVAELENAITQIRHDGLSFVLASQFPDRIPERIFKYLLTRFVFKLPNAKAISVVQRAAPNLAVLSPQKVSNLGLEEGTCFVQTDDDCSDSLMRAPQLLAIRPRCTRHGGATIRNVGG